MRALNKNIIGAVALGTLALAGQAGAGMVDTFQLDRLHIEKCRGPSGPDDCSISYVYDNHFPTSQANQPTPEVVGAIPWGNTAGAQFDQDRSRLALGGDQAVLLPTSGVSGNPIITHQAQLKTPTESVAESLGRGRNFAATTIWDWTSPTTDLTRYGMRLTDQGGGGGDPRPPATAPDNVGTDIVDLTVVNRGGTTYVQLRDLLADGTPAGDSVIDQIAVSSMADQIALQLSWDRVNNLLTASYAFTTGGVLPTSGWISFAPLLGGGATGSFLFSDDNFTQVRVYASSRPVPTPQALLLIAGGLLAMRLARRKAV